MPFVVAQCTAGVADVVDFVNAYHALGYVACEASLPVTSPNDRTGLLKRVRDFSEVHERPLSAALSEEAFRLFGIDELGLTKDDRRYLETLRKGFGGGPAGVRALASAMHEDIDTIEQVYEPYLLRLGFIERSSQGRLLTKKGREYLN